MQIKIEKIHQVTLGGPMKSLRSREDESTPVEEEGGSSLLVRGDTLGLTKDWLRITSFRPFILTLPTREGLQMETLAAQSAEIGKISDGEVLSPPQM